MRIEEALRLVLSVDHRDAWGELAQDRDRHERAVHRRLAAPLGLNLPPEHHLISVRRQTVRFEPGLDPGNLHHRLDRGAVLARANEVRRGTLTQEQPERVDQDRFAGSRLAGEQGEAGPQLQLQRRDERDVVDT